MHSVDEQTKSERILSLAQQSGVLRPTDLAPYEIQAEYLRRLCDRGQLKKPGRGSYVPATRKVSFPMSLALVPRAVPHGVVDLQSVLAFHKPANATARETDRATRRERAGKDDEISVWDGA